MGLKSYRILNSGPFLTFLYHLVGIYSSTFRLKVVNERPWLDYLDAGGSVLLCVWHQQFFSAIRYCRKYRAHRPSLMISQSRDGEIVAGVAERTGWNPVRGSSSRGGAEALKNMIRELRKSRLAGHIVDGPQGPAGIVKAGAIRLAHVTGSVVVPASIFPEKAWYFNSWDRFFLPKPFSRVTLTFGDMIPFKRVKNEAKFEEQRRHLEEVMRPALIGFQQRPEE